MSKILVVNCGSSSVKFKLFTRNLELLANGEISDIQPKQSCKIDYSIRTANKSKLETLIHKEEREIENYQSALDIMFQVLTSPNVGAGNTPMLGDVEELLAVGHRVVHGGTKFEKTVHINNEVMQKIKALSEIAPLHNMPSFHGIQMCKTKFPQVNQYAVFDTAYHRTMPEYAKLYPLPQDICKEKDIYKFGFHGIAHLHVSSELIDKLGFRDASFITVHLGNGCSVTAIKKGESIDNSMGFTPLEGLMMGTRCGDIDPSIVLQLINEQNAEEQRHKIEMFLNKECGLKAICGTSSMKDIVERSSEPQCKLGLQMFCYRIQKYIGAYFVALQGCQAIAFSGGIGENSPLVREMICEALRCLGVELDKEKNKNANINDHGIEVISSPESKITVAVVHANEEVE
eukprot:CAMPEP_0168568344 /NCGR_PEP_ID=MMETSP0413-20121227/15524_1 /TAXON_ID=136452 /ORGANISM="Filamoeba nolandi, Strain NC-AS-23-1" /LENGTH=401 /DNA_ID=CAMNT_0008600667 /DNA_START=144 /DNA_END=1346 /DNA_ORIENTATION=+